MSKLILAILNVVCLNEGARILGIFPYPGYSQYKLGSTLMKELASRGHEVTVISPFSQEAAVKNYKEIVTKTGNVLSENKPLYELASLNVFDNTIILYNLLGLSITEQVLQDSQVQRLIHSNATFDLVICELFVNEAHMGFAHHFQAPLILFCSQGAIEWANHLAGNPAPFSHVPLIYSGYTDRMDFWQRSLNTALGLFDTFYKHLVIFPKQNEILKRYFPNAPELKDLIYNSSLILLNSNIAVSVPMAHVPSMVEIGGFHVAPQELPKDLQEFLDDARDGAVFFSMGSNLNTSDLKKERIDAILSEFSKLKQKVLWKWENKELPGKPSNVKIGKWLPQQDILAHPNIRAFITHGGLLSTTEAVYHGVPMIGVPVFADQALNIKLAASNGFAIEIPFQEFTQEKFAWALNQILTNTSYKSTAEKRSKILKDRPMKPLAEAMFWIEYVLRHPGAPHLRSAALDLYWYQYFLLDVFAFAIATILALGIACKLMLGKIFRRGRERVNKAKVQ